ncbi:hypothetical protein MUK42_01453 [Musa troglodytarum]|uniref:Uncharacterized protein n=1 Tax=Musa troglodytarum TaxID=320322 RepID=A0A9E7G565_9LILI|nr:hypothetical protein MUK42_01453 [Musa troglodytarum]
MDRAARPDSAASRTGSACARYTSDGELQRGEAKAVPFALSLLCSVLRSTGENFVRGVLLTGRAAMPEKRKRAQFRETDPSSLAYRRGHSSQQKMFGKISH